MLTDLLCLTLIIAAISATLLSCFNKWRWLELYDTYRRDWMPERCDFCLGFWLSGFQALIYILITGNLIAVVAPFAAASITKKLLQ